MVSSVDTLRRKGIKIGMRAWIIEAPPSPQSFQWFNFNREQDFFVDSNYCTAEHDERWTLDYHVCPRQLLVTSWRYTMIRASALSACQSEGGMLTGADGRLSTLLLLLDSFAND